MRRRFVSELVALAEDDPRIVLLTGDLGYTVLEPFQEAFPDRFVNTGVSEQNMMGIATGLAQAGMRPFVYSIAPFALLRPYEFFRNGAVFQGLPVCVVGVGGGVDYSHEGGTHFSLEDVAVLRPFETVEVLVPADIEDAAMATRHIVAAEKPSYLRLGKDEQWTITPQSRDPIALPRLIRDGEDVLFVCLGPMVRQALDAAASLDIHGVSAAVALVSSFNVDANAARSAMANLLARYSHALTVEAHFRNGGLGSFVAEVVADHGLALSLTRCGFTREISGESGSLEWWFRRAQLDSENLVARAAAIVAAR